MRSYGEVALLARNLYVNSSEVNIQTAWKPAAAAVFPHSVSMQCKGCPKSAFLGLCEDGLVKGIPRGNYTRSVDNKRYAIMAVHILRTKPELCRDPIKLWAKVGGDKTPNHQMDVVIALWNNGLLQS